jgi:NAD+ kinase
VGGDGTLLHAAYVLGGSAVPVLGVNMGRCLPERDPRTDVYPKPSASSPDIQVEPRMKLRCTCTAGPARRRCTTPEVLNDVVIAKGALAPSPTSRRQRGHPITTNKADGIIDLLPTGRRATASANGPSLPAMNAVIVTQLPAHAHAAAIVCRDREIDLRLCRRPPRCT